VNSKARNTNADADLWELNACADVPEEWGSQQGLKKEVMTISWTEDMIAKVDNRYSLEW